MIIDINHQIPATAQSSNNMDRCSLAAVAVAVLQDVIDSVGVGWMFTVLGLLCAISAGLYSVERSYGMIWRLKRLQINTSTEIASDIRASSPMALPENLSSTAHTELSESPTLIAPTVEEHPKM